MFRKRISKGKLDSEGYADWHHVTTRVKEHEISFDRLTNRNKWFDMLKRLNLNETIYKFQHEQFKKERDYWKQIILRIIAVVKFHSKHNLAFYGSNEKLYKKGNYKLYFFVPVPPNTFLLIMMTDSTYLLILFNR